MSWMSQPSDALTNDQVNVIVPSRIPKEYGIAGAAVAVPPAFVRYVPIGPATGLIAPPLILLTERLSEMLAVGDEIVTLGA